MAIGSAIERGSFIFASDEHGRTLFSKAKGSGAKDGLLGFTRFHRSPCASARSSAPTASAGRRYTPWPRDGLTTLTTPSSIRSGWTGWTDTSGTIG
jgi:hypothetical protein